MGFSDADELPFPYIQQDLFMENTPEDQAEVVQQRKDIAEAMWVQYCDVIQDRHIDDEVEDYVDEDSDNDFIGDDM